MSALRNGSSAHRWLFWLATLVPMIAFVAAVTAAAITLSLVDAAARIAALLADLTRIGCNKAFDVIEKRGRQIARWHDERIPR